MQQSCASCGQTFTVTDEDLALLSKLSPVINGQLYPLPLPTHCPSCRCQRRLAVRNENKLYRRTSAMSGKPMISLYSPDKPYTVYSEQEWIGDGWSSMEYGVDYDFNRPFFAQFDELLHHVPRRGMHQDGNAENSDYTAFGINNKNCYLAFSCFLCEDVYYSAWSMAKNCVDCLFCVQCELLYECVDCNQCYHCFFCHESMNCQDSLLLDDCRNCNHCIACTNLRDKEYHIYNQPVSKEEFETKKRELLAGGIEKERQIFDRWRVAFPTLYARIIQSEQCTGNYIQQAQNCINCYDIQLGAQDLRHCQAAGWKGKDMMDCTSAGKDAEILYEVHGLGNACQRCAFFSFGRACEQVYYSENMASCKDCFGCVGLKQAQYCILNKQYEAEEYFSLVSRIIANMQRDHEWGEFFPIAISPFCYNETVAYEHFPLTKDEVLQRGWKWKDVTGDQPVVSKSLERSAVPDRIEDVQDDILDVAILCEATGKPFRIIKQELAFYRQEGLSLPRLHPEERHRRRLAQRTPYALWDRSCAQCGKTLHTAYAPERPEMICCEECYLKAVY